MSSDPGYVAHPFGFCSIGNRPGDADFKKLFFENWTTVAEAMNN